VGFWGGPGWIDFERLDDDVSRAVIGEKSGMVVTDTLKYLCRNNSTWQWVIHGDTGPYREVVCEELCRTGLFRVAKRFATCGLSDKAEVRLDGSEARVRCRFCGHRACPRCSRNGGLRMLERVTGVLGKRPHGAIMHLVLTQKADAAETLAEAKTRFQKKWKRLEWFRRDPDFIGGLASFHLKLANQDAWHYHVHFMVESTSSDKCLALGERMINAWRSYVTDETGSAESMFVKVLCDAGETFVFGDSGQGELFSEPTDPIIKALSYGLRDVVQGIERWVSEGSSRERIVEFIVVLRGAKLHRLYGNWRIAAAAAEDEVVEPEEADKPEIGGREWVVAGSMEEVLAEAKCGVELAVSLLRSLLRGRNGRSPVQGRLSALCRSFL